MDNLAGHLAVCAYGDLDLDKRSLVAEINRVIKPAQPATVETVHIGALMAASNQVNAQGGCFARTELLQLAALVIDAPVLIGHKKDELPIGRVFRGEIIERSGSPWLRAFFYWHRDQGRADEIRTGIDAGIYRECSLGFLYGKPECGVCRADMRRCRHRVNETVHFGGREIKAFYYYRQIERVLEISLVYRGAVAGTSVSTLRLQDDSRAHTATGSFELRKENRFTALLIITIDGITTRLRLLNFERKNRRGGRSLLCEDAGRVAARDQDLLLDHGSVRRGKNHADDLEFYGDLLRGRYRLTRKEERR